MERLHDVSRRRELGCAACRRLAKARTCRHLCSGNVAQHQVLNDANQVNAVLLTTDKDFGELVYRLKKIHAGVVLLRVAGLSAQLEETLLTDAIEAHAAELVGAFTVISAGNTRVRRPTAG